MIDEEVVQPTEINMDIPEKMHWVLTESARYKVAYGGRGSGKSANFCRALIIKALEKKRRILCTREYQNSIADSVHKLLSDIIDEYGLNPYFKITESSIVCYNGTEFIFKGLQKIKEIKSLEAIDICYIEEAAGIPMRTCDTLFPTIRNPGSEIWISFNPNLTDEYIYDSFVVKGLYPDAIVRMVNYWDNPFFPDVLRMEMEHCKLKDYDKYLHIWEGECLTISGAIIFKDHYEIKEFDSPSIKTVFQNRKFEGVDWGFADDPSVMTQTFIMDNCLYIEYEAYDYHVELDDLPALFNTIPDAAKWPSYADNSRPETISHVRKKGFPGMAACRKWEGCVEDGITYLKGFRKIYVHPRCKHTIKELGKYAYKVDKNTEEILPVIVDAWNHCIDSLRYGLDRYITNKVTIYDVLKKH